jgi:hypothetical protein
MESILTTITLLDATTAVNIFTDWVTAFMPIPLLWNVQLNRNTKVSVVCLLGLGFFASISACIRLKYTVNLTAQENYLGTSPWKWIFYCRNILTVGYRDRGPCRHCDMGLRREYGPMISFVCLSSAVMLIACLPSDGLGLIVGCVMTLRPLFRRVLHLGGDTSNKQSYGMSSARYRFRSSARRTYQECDANYELSAHSEGTHNVPSSNGYGNSMTSTQVIGGKREEDLSSFETESQKKILRGDDEASGDLQFPSSIVVTKHVKLSHDVGHN